MCLQFSLAWEISRYSTTVKLYLHEVYFFGTGFCWSYHIAYSVIFIGRVPTGTGSHPSLSYVDGFYYAGRNHPLTRVSSNNLSHTIFAAMTVDAIQSKLVQRTVLRLKISQFLTTAVYLSSYGKTASVYFLFLFCFVVVILLFCFVFCFVLFLFVLFCFFRWFSFCLIHISFSAHLRNFRWIKSKLALNVIRWFIWPLSLQKSNVWNMSKSFKGSCCCCCGISLCLGFVPSLAYTRAKEVFFKRPLITGTIWWTVVVTKKQTNKEYHVKCSSSISSCNQNRWFKGSF